MQSNYSPKIKFTNHKIPNVPIFCTYYQHHILSIFVNFNSLKDKIWYLLHNFAFPCKLITFGIFSSGYSYNAHNLSRFFIRCLFFSKNSYFCLTPYLLLVLKILSLTFNCQWILTFFFKWKVMKSNCNFLCFYGF